MSGEDLCSSIELRFYNAAGTRLNRALPEARGTAILDPLADDGGISFTTPRDAQALQASPDLLEDGIVTAALVLQSGHAAVEVGGAELVPTSGTVIDEAGTTDITVNAPGLRHLFTRSCVYPEAGGYDYITDDTRLFGWMSKRNAYWYSTSDWTTPTSLGSVTLTKSGWVGAKLTADASPADGDRHLFRTTFTLTAVKYVRIVWRCDDSGRVYLDSKLLDTYSGKANHTQVKTLRLSAGTHTLAAEIVNTGGAALWFAALVITLNNDGSYDRLIRSTATANTTCHKVVSGVYPGWSVGAILRQLQDEAVSRGDEGMSGLSPDFNGATDSAGVAWPELHTKTFPIGAATISDVIAALEEIGADIHVKGDRTWQAFRTKGSNLSSTVQIPVGKVKRLVYNGVPPKGTRALIRHPLGWTVVNNTSAQATYGIREEGIVTGSAANASQAITLGTRVLDNDGRAAYAYTLDYYAFNGCVPWLDFQKGDIIKIPNRALVLTSMRVMSISAKAPDDTAGPVLITLELDLP